MLQAWTYVTLVEASCLTRADGSMLSVFALGSLCFMSKETETTALVQLGPLLSRRIAVACILKMDPFPRVFGIPACTVNP